MVGAPRMYQNYYTVIVSQLGYVEADAAVSRLEQLLPSGVVVEIVDNRDVQVSSKPRELQINRLRVFRRALEEVRYNDRDRDILLAEVEQIEMWLEEGR